MAKRRITQTRQLTNRAGFPIFAIGTVSVAACYWAGDFTWIPTTFNTKYCQK